MSDIKQALTKKNDGGMGSLIKSMEGQIRLALPEHLSNERFQRQALTVFNSNPQIQKCDPKSFLAAMMTAAQLGLELTPTLGQAYLIPYGGQVQFQLGYRGLMELAYRSGRVKKIEAREVYENDGFEPVFGTDGHIKHLPLVSGDRGKVIGYYAVVTLENGVTLFEYATKEQVLEHAKKYSKTFQNGPWQTEFDEMAKKTVTKAALKYAPLSTELRSQVQTDETIKRDIDKDMTEVPSVYVDVDAVVEPSSEAKQIEGQLV